MGVCTCANNRTLKLQSRMITKNAEREKKLREGLFSTAKSRAKANRPFLSPQALRELTNGD